MACFAGAPIHNEAAASSMTHTGTDYSLDDDELLALAATQLDVA